MKRMLLIAMSMALIGVGSVAKADDLLSEKDLGGKFSANVGFVTEYLFRDTTQSGNGTPAVQGGFDFAHNSGVYLGIWGSSINFGGNLETDFYGGWSGDLGKSGLSLDVGAIYYTYPGATSSAKLNYWEGYVGLSKDFGFASGGLKFSYSPDWTGSTGSAEYLDAHADIPAGKYFTINLHAGHQWFKDNSQVGLDDYTDYLLGVSFGLFGFNAQVAYINSDLSNSQLSSVFGQDGSEKLIASLTRSF